MVNGRPRKADGVHSLSTVYRPRSNLFLSTNLIPTLINQYLLLLYRALARTVLQPGYRPVTESRLTVRAERV